MQIAGEECCYFQMLCTTAFVLSDSDVVLEPRALLECSFARWVCRGFPQHRMRYEVAFGEILNPFMIVVAINCKFSYPILHGDQLFRRVESTEGNDLRVKGTANQH
jgi:hypothetical protein